MILALSAWDLLTLEAIEDELHANPGLSEQDIIRIVYTEAFQFVQPTPQERRQPN